MYSFQSISSLCTEPKAVMLICYYACSLLYLERLFCFTSQTQFALQHGGVNLVTTDREFSHANAPYLYTAKRVSLFTFQWRRGGVCRPARAKRLCCSPAYQISSAIRVFFKTSDVRCEL